MANLQGIKIISEGVTVAFGVYSPVEGMAILCFENNNLYYTQFYIDIEFIRKSFQHLLVETELNAQELNEIKSAVSILHIGANQFYEDLFKVKILSDYYKLGE